MDKRPPFPIPNGKTGRWIEIPINEHYTDGDARHWPGKPTYRPITDTHYLINLANSWMKSQGIDEPNANYYLDKLPDGYALFETDGSGPGQTYKRLWGHPSGRFFDSTIRFAVHFIWLMSGMEGDCECFLDTKQKPVATRKPRTAMELSEERVSKEAAWLLAPNPGARSNSATGLASEREKRQGRPPDPTVTVDEEGNEDIYKKLLQELHRFKNLRTDEVIKEKSSIDWRADRKSLPGHLSQISLQHSFIPRLGELVLWCLDFPENVDLIFNPETHQYQFYSFQKEHFVGFPKWRGGVITATPSSSAVDGPPDFPDILLNPTKKTSVNKSGFRVETFPDPNNDIDKTSSKQYKYVSLRHIRPLSQWLTLLRGIPDRQVDPSVKYALTGMTNLSLLEKYRFVGDWPNASIHCKGIYLGADLIVVGDAVRIFPSFAVPSASDSSTPTTRPKDQRCTDVLVVSSVRLNVLDVNPEHILPESALLGTSSSVTLVGQAYTLDPRRDYHLPVDLDTDLHVPDVDAPQPIPAEVVKSAFPTVGAAQFGDWFPLHPPNKRFEISFDRVLGRMYEADAVRMWTGMTQNKLQPLNALGLKARPSLSHDLDGVLAGRRYATMTDERIPETAKGKIAWFWADTRVEALSLQTFNGYEVGVYDEVRDSKTLQAWRATLKVIDGTANQQDVRDTNLPLRKGRPKGSRLVDGRLVQLDQMVFEMASAVKKTTEYGKEKERRFSMGYGPGGGAQGSALRGTSQMVGVALEDSEDESTDVGSGFDANNFPEDLDDSEGGRQQPKSQVARGKEPMTKEQIMRSVEAGLDDYDDDEDDFEEEDEDEDDPDVAVLQDLYGPPPLARGGTEESETGDYNPLLDLFEARGRSSAESGSRSRDKRMKL